MFVWGNVCLFINQILKYTSFDAGLEMYALGVPAVILFNLLERDYRFNLLFRNLNQFHSGEDVATQLKYLTHLVQDSETDKYS